MTTMIEAETSAGLAVALGVEERRIVGRFGERALAESAPAARHGVREVAARFVDVATGTRPSTSNTHELLRAVGRADIAAGSSEFSTWNASLEQAGTMLVQQVFDAETYVAKRIARWSSLPNFLGGYRTVRLANPRLPRVPRGAPIPASPIEDAAVSTPTLATSADNLIVSRETIVNSDGALIRELFTSFGRRAAAALERELIEALSESVDSLFSTANGNKLSASALNATSLSAAFAAMGAQREPGAPDAAELTAARPRYLLTAPANHYAGLALCGALPPSGETLTCLASPWLGTASLIDGALDTTWYLLANPEQVPVLQVVVLAGAEAPSVVIRSVRDVLGVALTGVWDFAAASMDYRAAVKTAA